MSLVSKVIQIMMGKKLTAKILIIGVGVMIGSTPLVVGALYIQGKLAPIVALSGSTHQPASNKSSSGSSAQTGTNSSKSSGNTNQNKTQSSSSPSGTGGNAQSSSSSSQQGGSPSGPVKTGSCATTKRTVTVSDVTSKRNSGYSTGTQLYVPDGPDPWGGCFPGASSTGIPGGASLTSYAGPCTVNTANTIIDSKTINCDMTINGSNITIKNSKINATNLQVNGSLVLVDSEVDFGTDINGNGLTGSNITVLRANMHGGKREVWCDNCTVQDSYLHDQLKDPSGVTHESAVRIDQNVTLTHNAFLCNAPNIDPDAGCSANQTGYPDFEPVNNVTIKNNYYLATTGGYCSYGGATSGKPYSNNSTNATNIKLLNNVFQRGTSANDRTTIPLTDKRRYTCGYYGVTTAFDSSKAGFQFSGNMWDDGFLFANDTSYPYTFFD